MQLIFIAHREFLLSYLEYYIFPCFEWFGLMKSYCIGWWRYDERANAELEAAYTKSEDSVTLLIAGYLYELDLIDLVQMRKSEPNRRRRIKRDVITAPSKGVAGLREEATDFATTFSRMSINDPLTLPSISDRRECNEHCSDIH